MMRPTLQMSLALDSIGRRKIANCSHPIGKTKTVCEDDDALAFDDDDEADLEGCLMSIDLPP